MTYLPTLLRRKVAQGDEYDVIDVLRDPIVATYKFDDGTSKTVERYVVRPRNGFAANRWATESELDDEYIVVMDEVGMPDAWHSSLIPPTSAENKRARALAELHGLPDPTIRPDLREVVATTEAKVAEVLAKVDALTQHRNGDTP